MAKSYIATEKPLKGLVNALESNALKTVGTSCLFFLTPAQGLLNITHLSLFSCHVKSLYLSGEITYAKNVLL